MSNHDPATAVLPIQRVTTLGAKGTSWHLTVACPAQGHVVDAEACASCARLRHLLPPDEQGRSWIVCEPGSAPTSGGARVADVMTTEVFCVGADVSVRELVELFAEKGFHALPVVDAQGAPIGALDKACVTRLAPEVRARDVMRPTVALTDTTPLTDAARAMAAAGVHQAPVVDADGHVIGILSALDVLAWLGRADRVERADRSQPSQEHA